jgi:N-acetylglucosamine-6-phosphate deacetylase
MKVIDVHTHGIGGVDTRSASVDALLRIAEIHGASGVSEIVLSIYPAPIQTMRRQMGLVRKAMEEQGQSRRTVRPTTEDRRPNSESTGSTGNPSPVTMVAQLAVTRRERSAARIIGVHLEGPFLNPARCGALDPASFIEPGAQAFHELVEGFDNIIKMITVAPELRGAPALIKKMTKAGIVASMGHSEATYSEAEKGWRAGARGITHLFNAMRGFHHREPGLAGFGLLNRDMYVEVIADPYHLHPATLEMIFTMKNPERILIVSDSVKDTKATGRGRAVADAHGSLRGGSMTVTESSRRLIEMGFDEVIVRNAVAANPERYLRLNRYCSGFPD